jgi:Tfp pilus assembly protein PilN
MWQKIRQKILRIQRATGLEISPIGDDGLVVSAVVLRLEKNKIVKEKEIHFLSSSEELAKKIPLDCPVAVTVTGRGVLYKQPAPGVSEEDLFGSVLPNANPNEFHMEPIRLGSFFSVSIARKELLNKILGQLKEQKLRVLSISPGPAGLARLLPFLNVGKQPVLKSNHYTIHIDAERLVTEIVSTPFDKDEDHRRVEYSIGDQYVYAPGLLAFAAALELLAEGAEIGAGMDNAMIRQEREEYRYFKYFRTALVGLLSFVFLILLVNFFIYNHYFSKNAQQQASMMQIQEEQKREEKLRSTIAIKEKFIHDFGWDHPSRLSFYADRIAGLVPESTTLTDMKLFPVNTGFLGDNSLLTFKRDTIQIAGTCDDPTELNRFVNNLRSIPDFRLVTIKNYLYRKQTQNGSFLMEIITT